MPTTGKTLRKLRRSLEITTVALADEMGISRQTLWALERAAEVSGDRATQYRAAVDAIESSRHEAATAV